MTNRAKGDVLEDIVALVHEGPDVLVHKRVKVPTHDGKRKREIDVLLSGKLSHYPMYVVIECKNYQKAVTVKEVGEFKDKLDDIDLSPVHGILVTTSRFTSDARARAAKLGIRTLRLHGLTPDRMAREIYAAFQSVVFILGDIASIKVRTRTPTPVELALLSPAGKHNGYVMDLIWAMWRDGAIPHELGEHVLDIELPQGWSFKDGDAFASASAKVRVSAVVMSISGSFSRVALADDASGEAQKINMQATFDTSSGSYSVNEVWTEHELENALDLPGVARFVFERRPVPRLRFKGMYWPPSDRMLNALADKSHRAFRAGYDLKDLQKLINLQDLEGYDLHSMWEPIASTHPAIVDENWPYGPGRN